MIIIGGPCSFESREMTLKTIEFLHDKVDYIRGGINKYRSDPEAYQGNPEALEWVAEAKKKWSFKYMVEVFTKEDILAVSGIADVYQVGSRNMQNTSLLKELNSIKVPVLLKRHYAASLQEFIKHAEYLNDCEVMLCLRGCFSPFPNDKRFQPDFDDIMRLKAWDTDNKYKIIYDVSHSSGHSRLVPASTLSAIAFQADGLMIEVHPNPPEALSDPDQQLTFKEFAALHKIIRSKT